MSNRSGVRKVVIPMAIIVVCVSLTAYFMFSFMAEGTYAMCLGLINRPMSGDMEERFADTIAECRPLVELFAKRAQDFDRVAALMTDNPDYSFELWDSAITMDNRNASPKVFRASLSSGTCPFYDELDVDFLQSIGSHDNGAGYINQISADDVGEFVCFYIETDNYDATLYYTADGEVLPVERVGQYIQWLDDHWYIEYYLFVAI